MEILSKIYEVELKSGLLIEDSGSGLLIEDSDIWRWFQAHRLKFESRNWYCFRSVNENPYTLNYNEECIFLFDAMVYGNCFTTLPIKYMEEVFCVKGDPISFNKFANFFKEEICQQKKNF